jgi:xylulokinase
MTSRRAATLGIDVGTTETKAGLVSLGGELLGLARHRHSSSVDPSTGRAEQDPEDWWLGLVETVRQVVAGSGAGAEILALAVDGHGPTLAPVDGRGRAVRQAITWQDTRSAAEAASLAEATGQGGWALGALPAARWLEVHEPEAARQTSWYLNSWEALTLRLTGRAVSSLVAGHTPPAPDDLRASGLSVERIAPAIPAGSIVGPLLPEVAQLLGLRAGTPVVAGVVDAYASLHGARMLDAGDAIDVGGAAGGFGLYWTQPLQAAGSFTARGPLPSLWLIGGAMAATGASLDWFRDAILGGSRTTTQLLAEAATVSPGADGLLFLPYLAGERSPLWDPAARGAFAGLTLRHDRAALTRAILEASAFALRHVAAPILAAGGLVSTMRVCGGPARDEGWNQIKADVTGFPVEVPRILETAVVGSAILAAAGVGAHPDLATAIRAMATIDHRLEPDPALEGGYDEAFAAYVRLHPAISAALRRSNAAESRLAASRHATGVVA